MSPAGLRPPPPIRTVFEELELMGVRFRHYGVVDRSGRDVIKTVTQWSQDTKPGLPHPFWWAATGCPGDYATLEEAAEALCARLAARRV